MRYKVGASVAMVAACVGNGRDGVGTGGTAVGAVEGDEVGWRLALTVSVWRCHSGFEFAEGCWWECNEVMFGVLQWCVCGFMG